MKLQKKKHEFLVCAILVLVGILISAKHVSAQCVVPPEGLVAWWPAEGSAIDVVNGNNGTSYGGTTFVSGLVGQAFSFDGLNDLVLIPRNTSLEPQEITLDAWVKANSFVTPYPDTKWNGIIAKQANGNPGSGDNGGAASYSLGVFDDGKPAMGIFDGSAEIRATSPSPISTGAWHHIAGTAGEGEVNLYVDGQRVASVPWTGQIFYNVAEGYDLEVGAYLRNHFPGDVDFAFDGLIDEVGIFSRALSGAEIGAIFGAGTHGKCRMQISIEIRPGSDTKCLNSNAAVIPVAILGSASLDVSEVDSASVRLNGQAVKAAGKSNKLLAHIEDVNGDGFPDLVVQIQDADGVFSTGTGTAFLTGDLTSGSAFYGTDAICVVP